MLEVPCGWEDGVVEVSVPAGWVAVVQRRRIVASGGVLGTGERLVIGARVEK